MSKSKNYHPEEKRIKSIKPPRDNATKYKHSIYNFDPELEEEYDEDYIEVENTEK